jgi:Leucine-rich repeat (LRR) protein
LNLSQNNIKQIPEKIYDIINLKQLIARKNQITEFPVGLGKHKKLEIINLETNKITKMPD